MTRGEQGCSRARLTPIDKLLEAPSMSLFLTTKPDFAAAKLAARGASPTTKTKKTI